MTEISKYLQTDFWAMNRVRNKREARKSHMPGNGADSLVFLDENGANIDMTRHYARIKAVKQILDASGI